MGRFVSWSDWEIWHVYGGGLEQRWKYCKIQAVISRAAR